MNCLQIATIGLHLASVHDKPHYNDANLGAYVETSCGIVVGAYYNSYRRPSVQLAWRGEPEELPFFFETGLVTGYPHHDISPYAMAGVRLGPMRIGVVPHVPGCNKATVVHAMVQFKL